MKSPVSIFSLGHLRPALVLAVGATLLAACNHHDSDNPQPATTFGPLTPVGIGAGRTYVTVDPAGNPTEIGIRLTADALNGLPSQPTTGIMYNMALPASAAKTPFDHVSLDWNPIGHTPMQYLVPHFDAHFYMQDMTAQNAITQDDPKGDIFPDTKTMLPAGYMTAPNVAPDRTTAMMGRHWVDPTSPEFQPSGSFTSTFVYGTYDGHVTFLEPMLTKAMLTPTVNFSAPVKQPQMYEKTGKYFPTTYSIRYDAAASEYVISMGGLTLR
jgi:hypothetical protein